MSWRKQNGRPRELFRTFPPIWLMHVYPLQAGGWCWAIWRGEIGIRGTRVALGEACATQREAREACELAVVELVKSGAA